MKKQINIRIEEDLINKLQTIAEEEERTLSQEITYLIKKEIKNYELSNLLDSNKG